jgi:hypothetical protein
MSAKINSSLSPQRSRLGESPIKKQRVEEPSPLSTERKVQAVSQSSAVFTPKAPIPAPKPRPGLPLPDSSFFAAGVQSGSVAPASAPKPRSGLPLPDSSFFAAGVQSGSVAPASAPQLGPRLLFSDPSFSGTGSQSRTILHRPRPHVPTPNLSPLGVEPASDLPCAVLRADSQQAASQLSSLAELFGGTDEAVCFKQFMDEKYKRSGYKHIPMANGAPIAPNPRSFRSGAITDPFLQASMEVEGTYSIRFQGRMIPLDLTKGADDKRRVFVGGAHCLISSVQPGTERLYKNVPNEEIIIKSFLAYSIRSRDLEVSIQAGAHKNILGQYQQLKNLGLSVPTLYNAEDVENNCGYFIFQRIPLAFSRIESDSDRGAIYKFLSVAYKAGIQIDLRPSNLRRNQDGRLFLVDFLETDQKGDPADLRLVYINQIKQFCQEGDDTYEYLMQAIDPS